MIKLLNNKMYKSIKITNVILIPLVFILTCAVIYFIVLKVSKPRLTPFQPSQKLFDISEETGKPDQYYCSFDVSRDRVAIIIKKGGFYDKPFLINTFKEYFSAVSKHLNIKNSEINKFQGSNKEEFDAFIEDLVKNKSVGYIMLVGEDLPIISEEDSKLALDLETLNNKYSYVEREKTVDDGCVDVAIASVVAPQNTTNKQKEDFIKFVFENFINYHLNPKNTYKKYKQDTFFIEWDDQLTDFGAAIYGGDFYDPKNLSSYNTIYFYPPVSFVLNSDTNRIIEELGKGHLFLMYDTHGSDEPLGLGLNDKIYTTNQDMLNFYEKNGPSALFVDIKRACGEQIISNRGSGNCCWPQTWLTMGAWSYFSVFGDPYHHNFERWLSKEKIFGRAIKKTYHNQAVIFGDILATTP